MLFCHRQWALISRVVALAHIDWLGDVCEAAKLCMCFAQVIVLFQRIEGVDVCLYCLYMQEYGEDAPAPNKRWVYLSYPDSIKYFSPETESMMRPGMALRTLVYHDILLSYLDYVKQRGFCSMFIWACPPLQVGCCLHSRLLLALLTAPRTACSL